MKIRDIVIAIVVIAVLAIMFAVLGKHALLIIGLVLLGFAIGFVVAARIGTVILNRIMGELDDAWQVVLNIPIKGSEAERELQNRVRQALNAMRDRIYVHAGKTK